MPDPIMNAGFYLKNPQGRRNKTYGEDGETRIERLPSSAGKRRDVLMLNSAGSTVNLVLTSHSANLDLECSQARYVRKKAKLSGSIPVGKCPVVMAMGGEVNSKSLCKEVQKAVADGKGCAHGSYSEKDPCKHLIAERSVRAKRQAKLHASKQASYETVQSKLLKEGQATTAMLAETLQHLSGKDSK